MNSHKHARLTPKGRALLVSRVLEEGWSVAAASQAAGRVTVTAGMAAMVMEVTDIIRLRMAMRLTHRMGPVAVTGS